MSFFYWTDIIYQINTKLNNDFNFTNTVKNNNVGIVKTRINENINDNGYLKTPFLSWYYADQDIASNGDGTYNFHENNRYSQRPINVATNRYNQQDKNSDFSTSYFGHSKQCQYFDPRHLELGYRAVFQLTLVFDFIEPDDMFYDTAYFGIGGINYNGYLRNCFLCRVDKKNLTIDKILFIKNKSWGYYESNFSGGWDISNPDPSNYTFFTPSSPIQIDKVLNLSLVIDDIDSEATLNSNDLILNATFYAHNFRLMINGVQEAFITSQYISGKDGYSRRQTEDTLRLGYILRPNNLRYTGQSVNPIKVLQNSYQFFRIGAAKEAS